MPRGKLPSVRQIEQLAYKAEFGDAAAMKELGNINAKLGRMMNQRLRTLEKAGETSDVYLRISYNLNQERPRFSQARTGTAEHLRQSALQSLRAAGYEKSTLTGIKEARQENIQSLFESLGVIEKGETVDKRTVDRMNRFFKSDYWKQNRRYFASGGLLDVADLAADATSETFDAFIEDIDNFNEESPWYQKIGAWVTF